MVVNVEIKNAPQDPGWDPGEAVAALTAAAIDEAGWTDRVIVSSFQVPTLLAVQAAGPRLALGALWGFAADPGRALAEAVEAGFAAVHPFVSAVDAELVGRAHAAGLAINVWTVNAPEDLRAMAAWGVDAVITDRLDEALAIAGGRPA
jgi:glycerophosphoryl diester phosphodiesterase